MWHCMCMHAHEAQDGKTIAGYFVSHRVLPCPRHITQVEPSPVPVAFSIAHSWQALTWSLVWLAHYGSCFWISLQLHSTHPTRKHPLKVRCASPQVQLGHANWYGTTLHDLKAKDRHQAFALAKALLTLINHNKSRNPTGTNRVVDCSRVYSSFRQQSGDHVAAAGRLFVQALLPQVISLMLWFIFNVKGLPTWSTRQPHWRAIAP